MTDNIDINDKILEIIQEKPSENINILVKNITKNLEIINYNKNDVFISASLIKIPIALCILNEINDKKIALDSIINIEEIDVLEDNKRFKTNVFKYRIEELLTWMIIESDNSSTNVLIKYLGFNKLNEYFKDIGLKDTKLERYMLDDEAIRNKKNNYTSLEDMYLCFKYIVENSILTPKLCKFFLDILYKQKINNQIPRYINDITFAHKTGGLDYLNSDVGVFVLHEQFYFIGISIYNTPLKCGDREKVSRLSKLICNYLKELM